MKSTNLQLDVAVAEAVINENNLQSNALQAFRQGLSNQFGYDVLTMEDNGEDTI